VILLLLLCCGLLAAQEPLPWIGSGIRCDDAHPVVREGLLYRLHLRAEGPVAALIPPLQLEVSLMHGGQALSTASLSIPQRPAWQEGCTIHLVAPGRLPPQGLRLIATLSDALGALQGRLEFPVDGIGDLAVRLEAHAAGPLRQDADPLPALWIEQAALLLRDSRRLGDCTRLLDLLARCDTFPASAAGLRDQPSLLDAFRARSDASVQPFRLHRPPQAVDGPALLLWLAAAESAPSKAAWPALDRTRLAQALAAGFTVLEIYPAGDPLWQDLARRRLDQTLATVRQRWPELAGAPHWIYAEGPACEAALAAAVPAQGLLLRGETLSSPPSGCHLARIGPRSAHDGSTPRFEPEDAAAWTWLRQQRRAIVPAPDGPALDYADGPFSVVLGSGEHAAALEQVRRNGRAFLDAWAARSQGDADWYWDREAEALLTADRHLVCFGNPRSNGLLARLFPEGRGLPLRWDLRQISHPASGRSWLRDQSTVVLRLPHPRHPGRWLYLCDGPDLAPLLGEALPLAGIDGLVLIDHEGQFFRLASP
jgi:hypothetical protein